MMDRGFKFLGETTRRYVNSEVRQFAEKGDVTTDSHIFHFNYFYSI